VQECEPLPGNLIIDCQADFPAEAVQLAVIPTSQSAQAELARERLQEAYLRLDDGGTLLASVDNPQDSWLLQQLETLFGKVQRQENGDAILYRGVKSGPLRRVRNFECEFAFRHHDRLFKLVSRPGVFSHRRLDLGARKLLNALDAEPGETVLELGCGTGAVSLAAAATPGVQVLAVDSNARAIDCVLRSARLNSLEHIQTEVSATGPTGLAGQPSDFSLILGNPPYYANFQIAETFLQIANRVIHPQGRLILVSKFPDWYADNARRYFRGVQIEQAGDYWIIRCTGAHRAI